MVSFVSPLSLLFYLKRGFCTNGVIVYYFFNDIYPANHNGQRPLDPPVWWQRLIRGNAVVDAELRQQARPADTAAAAPAVQLQ
jgi:Derlin-2/3